jgi:hypothetical protein
MPCLEYDLPLGTVTQVALEENDDILLMVEGADYYPESWPLQCDE